MRVELRWGVKCFVNFHLIGEIILICCEQQSVVVQRYYLYDFTEIDSAIRSAETLFTYFKYTYYINYLI